MDNEGNSFGIYKQIHSKRELRLKGAVAKAGME